MRVTEKWIVRFATPKGGWTREQLVAIGVSWPPRHGWKKRIIGKTISSAAQIIFEQYGPRKIQDNKRYRSDSVRQRLIDLNVRRLQRFWIEAAIHGRRLALLREFAAMQFESMPPNWWESERRRAGKSRKHWFSQHSVDPCFVCGVRSVEHAHHVIQLQYGGADITENKVPVCSICHADIHPWMPTDSTVINPPLWRRS